MPTLTTEQKSRLVEVYLVVFDLFAASVSDVASELGVEKDVARRSLHSLERLSLVTGTDVNDEAQGAARRGQYKEIVYQCWETYDSVDRATAEQTVRAKLGF